MRRQTGGERRGLTEHEGVGKERGEGNEEAAKAASDVCELGGFARASEGGVVGIPVELVWGGRVAQGMVGEGVRVSALAVVAFLEGKWDEEKGRKAKMGRRTWGRTSF